ncbi:MAG: hypothetical protein AB8I08_03505 [Sandaracinaceae bacterium]
MARRPWFHLLLVRPSCVEANLARVTACRLVPRTPNPWQVLLGIVRMQHRVLFRSDTVGTCHVDPVRPTWRARLLKNRALRLPCLLAERAVAPLDFSGLVSSRARIVRHLLGAHHDGEQFLYDLALLSLHDGALQELVERARAVVEGTDPRSGWLRDLVVYERYHERLLSASERALREGVTLSPEAASDPDISLSGYLMWCAAQPATPPQTLAAWRRGEYSIADGLCRRPAPSNAPPRPTYAVA